MADSTPQLSLAVGDRVVYPNQGVCRVSGVEAKEVAGQRLTFVTMKREEDGALVMVPQAKVQAIGLRKVATSDEVTKIFAFLKSDSDKADLDWKQRARTNLGRMSAGGLLGMAEVVKGLQVLSELRPLPNKERELYDNARHLLVAEIAVSLGMSECDAEDSVDVILFPVGKERPKRTAEEFKPTGEDGEEGLELGDDLGLDGPDLDLPPEEHEAPIEEPAEPEEGAEAEEPPKKSALSDVDVTQPMGTALVPDAEVPGKRKRGRPPKAKPAIAAAPAAPKKRGRPPKQKAAAVPAPAKKRGRPPKAAPKAAAKDKPKDSKKKK
ncbi:MAG: CarD family transcriptional regulator [Myxococcaceae bacterium]